MKLSSVLPFIAILATTVEVHAYVLRSKEAAKDVQLCLKQYGASKGERSSLDPHASRFELDNCNQDSHNSANPLPQISIHVDTSANFAAHILAEYDNLCEGVEDGFIEHPESCSKYIECSGGTAYVHSCPAGLDFNPDIKVCDYPENVDCHESNMARKPAATTQDAPLELKRAL